MIDELGRLAAFGTAGIAVDDLEGFDFWWTYNSDALVGIRERQKAAAVVSGSAEFFLGDGQSVSVDRGTSELTSWTGSILVPTLIGILEGDSRPELTAQVCLAVGRIYGAASTADRGRIDAALRECLTAPSRQVAMAACLGAGWTGSPTFAILLSHIALDEAEGQRAVGGGGIATELRAAAAHALGQLGATTAREDVRRYVVHSLVRCIEESDRRQSDVQVAALLGLSIVPLATIGQPEFVEPGTPPSVSRVALLQYVIGLLQSDVEPRLRVHLPSAAARLLEDLPEPMRDVMRERVAEAALAALVVPSQRPELSTTVAIALGFAGRPTNSALDERIVEQLLELCQEALPGTRSQAWLALGRIAAREGDGEVIARLGATLTDGLERARGDERSFCALALGLALRSQRLQHEVLVRRWQTALFQALGSSRQPNQYGAAALACALAGVHEADAAILTSFDRLPDGHARCATALALGLLDVHDAGPVLDQWGSQRALDEDAVRCSAFGLELLGNGRATRARLASDPDRRPSSEVISSAAALGELGGTQARAALINWLQDDSRPDAARAAAASALARLCEARELPPHARLTDVVCFAALPSAVLSFGWSRELQYPN